MSNVEKLTADGFRTVFIPEPRFGFHYISTGRIEVTVAGQLLRLRVIAFNWSAVPGVWFHSLN